MPEETSPLESISIYPGFGANPAALVEEIGYLRKELQELREEYERYTEWSAKERMEDRKRITLLEGSKIPQPKQRDRGEILRALINASGGKIFAKDARQKMGLDRNRFSELLRTMESDIECKPFHLDKRRLVLTLK